ncbi:MAG: protein kinase [Catenulispora sp.]|nr:protein kinase [Catenulispora sp.]
MTTHHTEPTGDSGEAPEGSRVGPYQLLTQLGSGAMGRVFLATDGSGRQAALKVVRSELADVPAFRKRFAREVDVASRVHGPHIAEIYDSRSEGSRPWLATEYVPGPTLQEAVELGGCFDSARLRAFAAAVADALKTIHAADVVHRDLKPSNILLGADGPKVIDFGVARAIDASLLTNTGQTLGTPAYMSPEQADGRLVESASDIFALGSLLVFASTGRLAFGDGPALAILHRVVNNEPDLEGVAEDDTELRGLIEQCLAKEPDDRPSPQQIIDAFGPPPWEPLAGVAWQQPPLGVGLPLTVEEGADAPTVAIGPNGKRGKRVAVISAATLAALILATVAIVEGTGDSGSPNTPSSAKVGEPLSGADSGGSFPSNSSSSSSSNADSSTSTLQTTGSTTSSPSPAGSPPAPVNAGGPPSVTGTSISATGGQNPGSQPSSSPTGARGSTSSAPASKTTPPASKSTTSKAAPPSATTPAPPPAHNPPAPFVHGEIGVSIPAWFGATPITVSVSWKAHSDATSYVVHYTVDNGTDKQVPVTGTSYSYDMYSLGSGSTSCIQLRTVNQYGQSGWYSDPIWCFNSSGQTVSGSPPS